MLRGTRVPSQIAPPRCSTTGSNGPSPDRQKFLRKIKLYYYSTQLLTKVLDRESINLLAKLPLRVAHRVSLGLLCPLSLWLVSSLGAAFVVAAAGDFSPLPLLFTSTFSAAVWSLLFDWDPVQFVFGVNQIIWLHSSGYINLIGGSFPKKFSYRWFTMTV